MLFRTVFVTKYYNVTAPSLPDMCETQSTASKIASEKATTQEVSNACDISWCLNIIHVQTLYTIVNCYEASSKQFKYGWFQVIKR